MYIKNNDGIYLKENNSSVLSYPKEGNDVFFELENKSFWFRHRNTAIKAILKRFPFEMNFADIGGGNGFQVYYLSKEFPNKEFYLLEPSYTGCLNACKRSVENVYCTTFDEFPFKELHVKGVGLFDVIEHIEDDRSFLSQLRNVTEKGTRLYLTVPAFKSLWSDVDDFSGHFRRYNLRSIGEVLTDAGWHVDFSTYFFSYLPPLVWTMRCLPNLIRGNRSYEQIKKSEQMHHKNSLSEKSLEKLHSSEISKLESGRINFGSSVFAVGFNK